MSSTIYMCVNPIFKTGKNRQPPPLAVMHKSHTIAVIHSTHRIVVVEFEHSVSCRLVALWAIMAQAVHKQYFSVFSTRSGMEHHETVFFLFKFDL